MTSIVLQALYSLDPRLPAIDDGTLRLTYGDLQRFVTQEEDWLSSLGARRCASLADNSARWIVTDLALLASGAVHVPIPGSFTASQVRHLLDDAAIDSVITDRPEQVLAVDASFATVARSNRTGLAFLRRERVRFAARLDAVAKITYTSGSTGTAKGVMLQSGAIERVAHSLVGATAGIGIERHMCVLPLPTLLENIAGVYAPLLLGAQIHARPLASIGMSDGRLNPSALLQAISAVEPGSLVLVPELLRVLLDATGRGWLPPRSLKFIAVGGASVSPELLEQAHAAGLPVFEGYGLSECASVVCLNTPAHHRPGSVGRPLPHSHVRIDASGEICVAGATMSGYLGDDVMNSAEIRTGDLGDIDADGYVYVRGRAKNMFITSMGRNVTPEWVERELVCEPAIMTAMVSGEARPYPVALISAAPSATSTTIDRAVARANTRLPGYAQVRRWAAFPEPPTATNGLLTANGRLRRNEIVARHRELIESLYDHEDSELHEFS